MIKSHEYVLCQLSYLGILSGGLDSNQDHENPISKSDVAVCLPFFRRTQIRVLPLHHLLKLYAEGSGIEPQAVTLTQLSRLVPTQ